MPLVTLTSDFGLSDSYVGQLKGKILSICPDAKLVDISHQISPGNITEAAILLADAIKVFPQDSIHLCVVDPGVGSDRAGLVVETKANGVLVGPDNGLFSYCSFKKLFRIDSDLSLIHI